jgi:hypothetical protein
MKYYKKPYYNLSGNKAVDDFINYTQKYNHLKTGKMEFVSYDQFENIELLAEGGFSQIYKATWVTRNNKKHINKYTRKNNKHINKYKTIALKKLNNSENITSKDLNEVLFYIN